jgi:hypothetical protein
MPLTPRFNEQYKASKENDNVLCVSYQARGMTSYMLYDFMARVMIVRTGSSEGGGHVTPFSQLDRESLVEMREKLIELGGNPPELPAEKPATGKPGNGLNL